ncbi:MAG: hypothetical protein LVR00_00795 [Rhabdochlamydiaceae bacterium]
MFAPNNEKKMGKEKKTTLWAIFPLIEVVANIGAGTALFLSGRLNVFGVYSLTTNTIPFVSNIIHKLSSLE